MECKYGEYITDVLLLNNQLIHYGFKKPNNVAKKDFISGEIKLIQEKGLDTVKELRNSHIIDEYYLSLNYDFSKEDRTAINLIGTLAPEKKQINSSKGITLAQIKELDNKEKEFYGLLYGEVAKNNSLTLNKESYLSPMSRHGLVLQSFIVYSLKNANGHYLNTMMNSLKTINELTKNSDLKEYFMKNWDGDFTEGKKSQFYDGLKTSLTKISDNQNIKK